MSRNTTQEEAIPYTRNHVPREQKSSKKKPRTEQLQNIISLRINDDEKKTLEKLTKSTSKSISEIIREAMICGAPNDANYVWINAFNKL